MPINREVVILGVETRLPIFAPTTHAIKTPFKYAARQAAYISEVRDYIRLCVTIRSIVRSYYPQHRSNGSGANHS